ncbi:MAG: ATP-binding protein [Gammaproteobacteria bacterium]|nr:ATP-binding protein [Gammaproteobacteria bacterium]
MENTALKQYLSRQWVEQYHILHLKAYSEDDTPLPKRFLFDTLSGAIERFLKNKLELRWILMPGLRGCGKTTLLAQLYFAFQASLKKRILYVSMDEVVHKLNSNCYELLDYFEEFMGHSFSKLTEKVLLLIDEVHFDPNWPLALKTLHDKSNKVFVIATGSSAIALHMTTDIARRAVIERMLPLKFTEYAFIANPAHTDRSKVQSVSIDMTEALFGCKTAEDVYHHLQKLEQTVMTYWQHQDLQQISSYIKYYSLPSVIGIEDTTKLYQILNHILDRIVEKDIAALKKFSQSILDKIQSLLFMLASTDVASLHSLSKNMNGMDIKTLMRVLQALEKSEVLLKIYPMGSVYKKVRRPAKYLFLASNFRAALLHSIMDAHAIDIQHKGRLLEDVCGLYFSHLFLGRSSVYTLHYDPSSSGADFILQHGKNRIILEVGWNKKNAQQVIQTQKTIVGSYGLLVTNQPLHWDKENQVVTVPLEYFFLL